MDDTFGNARKAAKGRENHKSAYDSPTITCGIDGHQQNIVKYAHLENGRFGNGRF